MRSDTDNSKHWRMRAAEARAMADAITDTIAKQTMLGIAASYEKLARRAEIRSADDQTNNPPT